MLLDVRVPVNETTKKRPSYVRFLKVLRTHEVVLPQDCPGLGLYSSDRPVCFSCSQVYLCIFDKSINGK